MNHTPENPPPPSDLWSEWLLRKRFAGDARYEQVVRGLIEQARDRVLDGAKLAAGMTLGDVGAGDGLIAFGAVARTDPSLQAILSDVSAPLLAYAEKCAVERGVRDRCQFLRGSAERLEGIADESVDVVTSRAALAYVADKPAALREFFRVLRPGGRISIAEPIFRDVALELTAMCAVLAAQEANAANDPLRLLLRWQSAQFPATAEDMQSNPLTNFSERNLISFCQLAGFGEIHLQLHIDVRPKVVVPWETFLELTPHPLAPSLREILDSRFSADERRQFVDFFRPLACAKHGYERENTAYLTAVKPVRPAGQAPDGVTPSS